MRKLRMNQKPVIRIGNDVLGAVLCLAAFASAASRTEKPAAVDPAQYADFIENEVFDIQDLTEGAEIQRRRFNRMTPPGVSWVQPMFPSVVPFDAENFDEKFLGELLGEDKNSVAIYPLSLALDPKTRETLVYNAGEKLIASIPPARISREWPEDATPPACPCYWICSRWKMSNPTYTRNAASRNTTRRKPPRQQKRAERRCAVSGQASTA